MSSENFMASGEAGITGGKLRLALVTPVFNDWPSFATLCGNIDAMVPQWDVALTIIAVDDGSLEPIRWDLERRSIKHIDSIEALSLTCNLGHQRAIAVGLSDVLKSGAFDAVIVADSDGEDRPEDIGRMIEAYRRDRKTLVVAQRAKRSEGLRFRIFYGLYKAMFHAFTGRSIDFGNFSLIPFEILGRLAYMPELWNHLAAAVLRSRVPLLRLPSARGNRYAGRSSMTLVSLLAHGMSAVSVFNDLVFVRLLALSAGISVVAVVAALIAIGIRMTTDIAIPGWATTVVGTSAIVIFESLILSVAESITLLGNRSGVAFIPATGALQFVRERRILVEPCIVPIPA